MAGVEAGLGRPWDPPLRERGDVLTQFLPLPSDFCRPASCRQGSTEPRSRQGQAGVAWACGGVGGGSGGRMTDIPWVVPVGATTAGE